jgi:hypothetical protein
VIADYEYVNCDCCMASVIIQYYFIYLCVLVETPIQEIFFFNGLSIYKTLIILAQAKFW